MNALLKRLSRAGLRRGLAGEHWAWLVLAGAAYVLRRARRPERSVATLALEPGQRYLVRLVSPQRRRRVAGTWESTDGWEEAAEPEVREGASAPPAGA